MRPRFDFECSKCSRAAGSEVIHRDLPKDSEFCPRCGAKRGFKKLFNTVQVSTRGHRQARFIDKRLRPMYDKHTGVKTGAKDFEKAARAAMDRAYEEATLQQREVLATNPQGLARGAVAASAAFSSLGPDARSASREHNWPMLQRHIRPEWAHR